MTVPKPAINTEYENEGSYLRHRNNKHTNFVYINKLIKLSGSF